jgi:hypothetical protein
MMDYATKNQGGGLFGNQNQGGLFGNLANINPNLLIGANIAGAGFKGQEPFGTVMPSVLQAAKIKKAFSPTGKLMKAKNLTTGKKGFVDSNIIRANPDNFEIIEKEPLVKIEGDKFEDEYSKIRGGQEADYFGSLMEKANTAHINIPQYDLISTFSQNLNTGFAGDLLLDIAKFGKRVNVDLDWLSNPDGTLKDGVATAETMQVLGVQFALDKIQKTKGAISDREFTTFITTSPALSMSPDGIQLLNTMNKRLGQRDIEVAALAQEWESNYGRLDKKANTPYGQNQSFNQFISKWKEDTANELFDKKFYDRVEELSKGNMPILEQVTKVVEGVRYRKLKDGTWIKVGGK